MKVLLWFALVACTLPAFGQGVDTNVPPDLAAARARYQDQLGGIKRQYLQVLQKLKADAILENNSELGTAVSREINAMGGIDTTATTDIDGAQALTPENVAARLTNSTWAWYDWETITFLRDGIAKWSGVPAPTFTWAVISVSPPTIEGKSGDGRSYKMILDANLRSGKIIQDQAPERPTARAKRQ